jgi:hypothetical protein
VTNNLSQLFTKSGDHAYYTLKGASISAIRKIFSPRVCDAIEQSDMRAWEKQHLLIDTTDCVQMEISRKSPHHGTIRLRIAFFLGMDIVNQLYGSV